MTEVHWLEAPGTSVPAGDVWLGPIERRVLSGLRVEKRRADWRLGRWTAKRAMARWLGRPETAQELRGLEVCAADDGAPEAFRDGAPAGWSLSLSHSGGWAICALAPHGLRLGCDVEFVEPRSEAFLDDVLVASERALVASGDAEALATLFWSAKESALKALRCGLRRDVRDAVVELPPDDPEREWRPLAVRCAGEPRAFSGWWRRAGMRVQTIVADSPRVRPVALTA